VQLSVRAKRKPRRDSVVCGQSPGVAGLAGPGGGASVTGAGGGLAGPGGGWSLLIESSHSTVELAENEMNSCNT